MSGQEREMFVCNDDIEYCATDQIFSKEDYITETPYIIVGSVIFLDLLFPLIYYWVRMGVRAQDTGTMKATNWVDIAGVFLWIFTMVTFITPFGMYPFHWLKSEALDGTIAWYLVNIIADVLPAISLIFFFWYLIIAFGAGQGSTTICDSNGANCTYNKSYISPIDGWITWLVYTIVAGAQYFVMFWFGADAVRYLRPGGGYELKFLYPSLIYELLVVVGAAPDSSRELNGHSDVFNKTNETASETVQNNTCESCISIQNIPGQDNTDRITQA